MPGLYRLFGCVVVTVGASALIAGAHAAGQTHSAPPPQAAPAPIAPAPTERDVAATQDQLIKLLRLSPKLTMVVARDPSLLSNQEYVAHNNPQLADFLASHPEVARNPDFYLFEHLNRDGGGPDEALERVTWPEAFRERREPSPFQEVWHDLVPLIGITIFLLVFTWVLRLFIENRRWSRIFTLQNEVHGRLIDKFSSSQELAQYMETDAGKRFLEAGPIPVNFGQDQRVPNAVARVMLPLQIGVVLVLLGAGFLTLQGLSPDMLIPMRVLGTLILMPGIGFIISAGITWLLAARLGLMPSRPETTYPAVPPNRFDTPFGSSEKQ